MENETEILDSTNETGEQLLEQDAEGEELDATALKEKLAKVEEANKQLYERAKKAEAKNEKQKIEKKAEAIVEKRSNTGELDSGDYALLAAKGYEDDDQVEFVHKQMLKWDMTLREVLKDEDVKVKLASIAKAKEVKDATPSGTRRAGGQSSTDVDYWVAKVEQGGELPKDIELKRKVINKIAGKDTLHTPPWRR